MSPLPDISRLLASIDTDRGTIGDAPMVRRHLADLRGCFRDAAAYEQAISQGNPLVYTVAAIDWFSGEGDLHYGLGLIQPGRIGDEYFLTKGHFHTWRAAAELYIGLSGTGAMLLEDEVTGKSELLPLAPQSLVYVPGNTAHRTVNTGDVSLAYLGVYSARAGHDYGALATRNFRQVVVRRNGLPCMVART
jgi:glucose-6-phosphate isomerase